MKRILLSLGMIVFVAGVAVGATGAFFSDTETSTGNTFAAGALDLKIDNESYAIDYNIPDFTNPIGAFVASANTSWDLVDLTVEKFFNFEDLKPGDYGEDTISLHVENNAWVCAAARVTDDDDNSITEPEDEVNVTLADGDGTSDGDLDSAVNIAFWVDDGDNVFESVCPTQDQTCVPEVPFVGGTIAGLNTEGQIAIADSNESVLPNAGPVPGGTDFYIAKAWCFGSMTPSGVEQDGAGQLGGDVNGPLSPRGTGFNCNGATEGNIAQTDSVVGDIQFYAEQSRNNTAFQCQDWAPAWSGTPG